MKPVLLITTQFEEVIIVFIVYILSIVSFFYRRCLDCRSNRRRQKTKQQQQPGTPRGGACSRSQPQRASGVANAGTVLFGPFVFRAQFRFVPHVFARDGFHNVVSREESVFVIRAAALRCAETGAVLPVGAVLAQALSCFVRVEHGDREAIPDASALR